jgi:hypothetical protein
MRTLHLLHIYTMFLLHVSVYLTARITNSIFKKVCFYADIICGTVIVSESIKDTSLLVYKYIQWLKLNVLHYNAACYKP